jgi:hypothetical protein
MVKTGPNDMSGIIWALGKFSSFTSHFFILTYILLCIYVLKYLFEQKRGAGMVKTGPNDARRVVWALFNVCVCVCGKAAQHERTSHAAKNQDTMNLQRSHLRS